MKKKIIISGLGLVLLMEAISCKKKVSDAEVQTQATTIVSSNSNTSVEIIDGVAHLKGTFSDEQSRDKMIADLKKTEGVKEVMDMSSIQSPNVKTTTTVDTITTKK